MNFYDDVYKNGNQKGEANGWIQWKGTDVCVDLHCKCGYDGHYDGSFLYFFECPACHAKYAVGQNIKLIPLTDEQANYVETETVGFKTCGLNDDA